MPLTRDVIRRAVTVVYAQEAGFVELVGIAELDRATAFRGISMRETDLRGEDLSGFDFTNADFEGADLRGADLTHTIGVTREMMRSARCDRTTRWPNVIGAVTSSSASPFSAIPDIGESEFPSDLATRVIELV